VIISFEKSKAFLQKPDPNISVVMFHGEDEGKTRSLADQLISTIGTLKTDPFSYVELTEEAVKADPAIISDEFSAMGFGSDRRIIRLRFGQERGLSAIAAFLKGLETENAIQDLTTPPLLILEAGSLTPKSELRKITEKSARMAAIPCQPEAPKSLRIRIEEKLHENGLGITADALATMLEICGENYASTDQEIEKLILFKHRADNTITLQDIDAILSGGKPSSLSNITAAILAENPIRLDQEISKAIDQNESPISILRTLAWQLEQPSRFRGSQARSQHVSPAQAKTRKRILFWSEKMLKQTGIPQWPFLRQSLTKVSHNTERN